jgi:glutamine amidotransferase
MIAIVNYGSGNIQAIGNIFSRLRVPFVFASRPEELQDVERIVLPGVGAFDQAMEELERSGMRRALDRAALEDRKPVLGICVGMQLLACSSEEGYAKGLGWIDGTVKKFVNTRHGDVVRLPHMGWNTIEPTRPTPLFEGIDLQTGYYFLHSYYFSCDIQEEILANTHYGSSFASVVQKANICGVQFHPEKSHQSGIDLLKNFAACQRLDS